MLKSLYGDDGNLGDRVSKQNDTEYDIYWASKTFEQRVKNRLELSINYLSNIFFYVKTSLCCCFRSCCNRVDWIRKGSLKYRKFHLALERLSKE